MLGIFRFLSYAKENKDSCLHEAQIGGEETINREQNYELYNKKGVQNKKDRDYMRTEQDVWEN